MVNIMNKIIAYNSKLLDRMVNITF